MSRKPDLRIRTLMEYFDLKYKEAKKVPYCFSRGKDAKLIKEMLGSFSEGQIKAIIDQLFISDDEFIRSTARTIGVLHGCCNNLAQECHRRRVGTQRYWKVEKK